MSRTSDIESDPSWSSCATVTPSLPADGRANRFKLHDHETHSKDSKLQVLGLLPLSRRQITLNPSYGRTSSCLLASLSSPLAMGRCPTRVLLRGQSLQELGCSSCMPAPRLAQYPVRPRAIPARRIRHASGPNAGMFFFCAIWLVAGSIVIVRKKTRPHWLDVLFPAPLSSSSPPPPSPSFKLLL